MKAPGKSLLKPFLAPAMFLALMSTASSQSTDDVPVIDFHSVPLSIAIENLAVQAGFNYIIDPKLFLAADGSPKPEPQLTFRWEHYPAGAALARVLKENGLVMTTNSFSTVVEVTDKNPAANQVDGTLLGGDTNQPIPLIAFSYVPLDLALKTFINQGQIKAVIDPQVAGESPPAAPDFKMVMVPTVSVRWHNLTARQALVEVCEVYGLVIVKGPAPDTVEIKPKE